MAVAIPRQYQARVVANDQLTPKIFWLRLEADAVIPYSPGQYGSFLIDTFRRPLSYAAPSSATLEFVVDISPGGVASKYVEHLRVNDIVTLMSPYGRFIVADTTRPLVFIASGSGIAPIRAQILDLLSRPVDRELTLVFGNRSAEYMFFLEEFQKLATAHPALTFIPTCSEDDPTWTGERGLVTEVTQRLVPDLAESDMYVCGGPAMVAAAAAMLETLAIPPAQIHTEKFA